MRHEREGAHKKVVADLPREMGIIAKMQSLLRISDVAAYLSTTPGAARNWLERNKVPFVDLGRGRGLGLRWRAIHVEEAVRAASQETAEKQPAKKPRPVTGLIRGRSREAILSELTDPSPVQ